MRVFRMVLHMRKMEIRGLMWRTVFFNWFSETQQKEDMDEIHDEVAEIIKEYFWTNLLTYFNNDANEEDFDGDEEEEGIKKKYGGIVKKKTYLFLK